MRGCCLGRSDRRALETGWRRPNPPQSPRGKAVLPARPLNNCRVSFSMSAAGIARKWVPLEAGWKVVFDARRKDWICRSGPDGHCAGSGVCGCRVDRRRPASGVRPGGRPAAKRFAETTKASVDESNSDLVERSDVVFLAVKPQQMGTVLEEIRSVVTPDKLIVSIAAGVPMAAMSSRLGEAIRLVRVMPNTPCLVGRGACGFCLGTAATEADGALVEKLLSAVGIGLSCSGETDRCGDRSVGLRAGLLSTRSLRP